MWTLGAKGTHIVYHNSEKDGIWNVPIVHKPSMCYIIPWKGILDTKYPILWEAKGTKREPLHAIFH